MTSVFMKILNMSLTAGYCIVVVMALRLLLRKQAKILSYLLWSVVLFRLLCPVSFSSSYSLLRMDADAISRESFVGAGETDTVVWQRKGYFDETGQVEETGAVAAMSSEGAGGQERTDWQQTVVFAARVWIAGIAVLLGYSLWSTYRCKRFLTKAVPVSEGIYEAEGISTPFVFGVFCPKIYLPAHLDSEERRYVLAHEQVHLARKDYFIKLLFWGALCLHWFNPLVWLAFALMERDMEMSCDEAVLRKFGGEVKQAYSLALLQLSCSERVPGGSPIAFGEGNVRSRIQNILGWHKRKMITVVSLAVLLGILILGLAINPMGSREREAEENLRLGFVDAYANAYCDRDGNLLVDMYADEETAYESLPILDKGEGGYSFGFSSPWPNEFRFVLTEGDTEEEAGAEIWYYAWTSDPHVAVWKEEIRFSTDGAYQVINSELRYLDSIASRADFDAAYLVGGAYRFTDYVERGFLEGINTQTAYDKENGGADRNEAYRSPDTAAVWILNLDGGQCEILPGVNQKQAVVRYTFADGNYVEVPMYQANDGATAAAEGMDGERQITSEPVWLVDVGVWNAKAP